MAADLPSSLKSLKYSIKALKHVSIITQPNKDYLKSFFFLKKGTWMTSSPEKVEHFRFYRLASATNV